VPCLPSYIRTVEEASNAMALDGIVFSGEVLRIRRPHDYNATVGAAQNGHAAEPAGGGLWRALPLARLTPHPIMHSRCSKANPRHPPPP